MLKVRYLVSLLFGWVAHFLAGLKPTGWVGPVEGVVSPG